MEYYISSLVRSVLFNAFFEVRNSNEAGVGHAIPIMQTEVQGEETTREVVDLLSRRREFLWDEFTVRVEDNLTRRGKG